MSISKAVLVTCLLLFSVSCFAQENESSKTSQPGFQVGLQVGAGHFLPFKTGGARQGGRNQISQINIETHGREPGIRIAGTLVKALNNGFSFAQELGALQSTNTYTFTYQGLSNGSDFSSGTGSALVSSTYLQSITGLQFGTQGPLKLGVQVGLEINIRLAERADATLDPGDSDAMPTENLQDFPDIVESIVSRDAFLGAAGAVYVGYAFGRNEVRLQARNSVSRLSSQRGALDAQWFPRMASASLVWLVNLH